MPRSPRYFSIGILHYTVKRYTFYILVVKYQYLTFDWRAYVKSSVLTLTWHTSIARIW